MKTIRRTQMEAFSGATLSSFKEDFNRKMDALARKGIVVKEPVINFEAHEGYALYEETWREPESLRDHFDLSPLRVTCGQCKHFEPTKYSWGQCKFCKGELRKADEPCDTFWKEWERGNCFLSEEEREVYEEIESKYRRSRIRSIA